ncbi:B12-binding domain-containing radical SAM protein [Myxococcota bacterium]|nr:B12-binding domain-containing radical SAM protein [Myxococcota bacterium]
MARILLVKVARFGRPLPGAPPITVSPPLGILSLASLLRERRGDRPAVLDMRLSGDLRRALDDLAGALRAGRPEIVGLSALSVEHECTHAAAALVRRELPGAKVVVGGPHGTAYPRRVLQDPAVDFVVRGEGEEPLLALRDHLVENGGRGAPPEGLGICHRVPGEDPVVPDSHVGVAPLDEWPIPAWDLFDFDRYARHPVRMGQVSDGLRHAAMSTTRACPYRCTYCHNIFGKDFRTRSVDRVLEELELLRGRHRVRTIEFYDDVFNLDRRRMGAMLTGMMDAGLRFNLYFPNGLRADLLRDDEVRLLKAAGTKLVSVAVESASPRIQKRIRKNLDVDRVFDVVDLAARERLFVRGFFMLGFPTETEEEARATLDWAVRSRLHLASFFTVTPYGATEMADGLGLDEHTAPLDAMDFQTGVNTLSAVAPERLAALQQEGWRRFYFDPDRIRRIVRDSPALPGMLHARLLAERVFLDRFAGQRKG